MRKISRQSYAYLCGAFFVEGRNDNPFTGSLKIDENKTGAFADKFNYKVNLLFEKEIDGEKEKLKLAGISAAWHIGCFSFDAVPEDALTVKIFEASDKGAEEAFDWIQSEFDRVVS